MESTDVLQGLAAAQKAIARHICEAGNLAANMPHGVAALVPMKSVMGLWSEISPAAHGSSPSLDCVIKRDVYTTLSLLNQFAQGLRDLELTREWWHFHQCHNVAKVQ